MRANEKKTLTNALGGLASKIANDSVLAKRENAKPDKDAKQNAAVVEELKALLKKTRDNHQLTPETAEAIFSGLERAREFCAARTDAEGNELSEERRGAREDLLPEIEASEALAQVEWYIKLFLRVHFADNLA